MEPAVASASASASGSGAKPVKAKSEAGQGKGQGRSNRGGRGKKIRPAPPAADGTDAQVVARPSASAKKRAARKKKGKKKKDKVAKEARDDVDAGPKIKLKVVVRRLPPNLPEEVFWKAISPFARRADDVSDDDKEQKPGEASSTTAASVGIIEHGYFVAGKLKDGSRRGIQADSDASPHTFSRAYLRFGTTEALVGFHRSFDGHLFRDAKGNEYAAVVEFAPFQKMAVDFTNRRKLADLLQGTIEGDSGYKQFLAALQQSDDEAANVGGGTQAEKTDAQLMAHLTAMAADASQATKQAKSTPLLEHLRAQRSARGGSAALKQARNYLQKSHGAYAAALDPAKAASTAKASKKAKAKSSVKGTPAAAKDPSIPTGPKAMQKKEKAPKASAGMASQNPPPATAASNKPKRERKRGKGSAAGGATTGTPANGPKAPAGVAILARGQDASQSVASPAAATKAVDGAAQLAAVGAAAGKQGARSKRGRGGGFANAPRSTAAAAPTAAPPAPT